MALVTINIGTNPNDGTGESLRSAWSQQNAMNTEIFALQSDTINAGAVAYNFTGATNEQRIALADADAVAQGKSRLFIPASLLPYDIGLCPASAGVQRVREGGDQSVYDVQAYGADPIGVIDAGPAFNATRGAIPSAGGPMRVSFGSYVLTTAFTFAAQTGVTVVVDPGTTLSGQELPVPGTDSSNTIFDFRRGIDFTGALNITGPANLPVETINSSFCRMSVGGGDFQGVGVHPGQCNVWAVGIGNDPEETGVLVLRHALGVDGAPTVLTADKPCGTVKFGGYRGDPGGGASPWVTSATVEAYAQNATWSPALAQSYIYMSITDSTNTRRGCFELRSSGTANDIWMRVYDFSAGGLVRVSRGAADSGGLGFRLLRVPN